jgi:hypothetical protein
MPLSKTRFRKGVIIAADADALEGIEGEIKIDSADNKIKTTLNATPHEVVTNDQSQTLSNKTITSPVINTGVSGSAIDTDANLAADSDTLLASQKAVKAYVDAVAGAQDDASEITVTPAGTISSTNVQAALEELDTDIQNHLSDTTDAHDASAISNVPAGSIAATDVQAAINELDTDIQNHITDSADAHDASAISNVPSGNLVATDVQAALNELQGDIDTNTSGISNHLSDASDAHDASAISVVPTGNLAASDVQAALNELQGDADAAATHIGASTDVHGVGVGNSVVGTGTSQVLTNKTITGADIRTPVRSDVKQDTKANLITYALTASNGQLVFATDTKEMFQVVDTLLEAVGGGAGIGGVDILFSQTFEEAAITDFTQTGMSLSTSSPIHGAISALMTHQAVANQSFKQVIAVDEKFRGQAMLLELNVKSTASAGNVTIKIYDETNAANIVASEQLTLSSATGGIKDFVAFTIPATCLSLSYTVTALPEAGSPVTRIDDILCQLNNAALLETSVTVPNITAWAGYTPVFQGFGTPSAIEMEWRQVGENVEIRGKFTSGTPTAVEARVGLPNSYTSAGTGLIPSIQLVGQSTNNSTGAVGIFNTLIEPSVSYVTLGFRDASTAGLGKQNGTSISVLGTVFSFFASVPVLGLTATSDVAIPLTQSGIVQEADSMVRVQTFSAYGAVATKIPRFSTLNSSLGSDILYTDDSNGGASFIVQTSGDYAISFSFASNTAYGLGITLNSSALTTNISSLTDSTVLARTTVVAGNSAESVSWTGYLVAGSIIRPHTDGIAASGGNQSSAFFTITRQGSLKQVTVNTNSKITIPTSELRFEGASARGTGGEASTIQWTTLAKIRGDAFSVSNTNGTLITMTKAGRVSVSASAASSVSTSLFQIFKNSQNKATGQAFTGTATVSISSTFDVAVGDVVKVAMGNTPTSSSNNILEVVFQEQDIQVSVSNTLPQFSESDSCVRLTGANGFGSSATTTRRFASVVQNLGTDIEYIDSATLGGQFIAKASGIYNLSYTEESNANVTSMYTNIKVNGTTVAADSQNINTANADFKIACASWQGYLTIGDVVTASVVTAANNNGNSVLFTISKVGKPNVTGVNVTPFVNVPQPVSQSSFIDQTASFGNAVITGALGTSEGSGLYSYNATTGTYTALKTINVNLSVSLTANAAAPVVAIVQVGATITSISHSASTTGFAATAAYSGKIIAGNTFNFLNGSTNVSSAQRISVLATATSDSILTAPETFSTDTAALTYAGSGTYTLATLANAPVGTFITFTYATSTNTRTQTTTAPTQTTADMNANGMLIYTRAYNAASTAALPAVIAIQIGKGLKGKSLDLYKSAGKVTAGSLDAYLDSSTVKYGCDSKDYNEATGILVIDAGLAVNVGITSALFRFSDVSSQTSGYLVVNASKNPALVGVGIDRVAARAVSTSAQSIANTTFVPLVWDAVKTFDTHNALNAATGVFTAPVSGYYQVSGMASIEAIPANTGSDALISIFKNGVGIRWGQRVTTPAIVGFSPFAYSSVSDVVYLAKGDTCSLSFYQGTGAARSLTNQPERNTFSIAKISGIN